MSVDWKTVLKNSMKASSLVPLAIGLTAGLLIATHHVMRVQARQQVYKAERVKAAAELVEFKARYEALVADRNNILTQTKILLGEKGKFSDVADAYEKLKKLYENQMKRKQKLLQLDRRLALEKASALAAFDQLAAENKTLKSENSRLQADLTEIRAEYSKKVQDTPLYKTLLAENKELAKDNRWLAEHVRDLEQTIAKSKATIKSQTEAEKKLQKKLEVTTKARDVYQKEKTAVLSQNKQLHREVKVAPSKFRTLAEENRQMLRETADMHYNLGVFYLQQKKFDLAVREFRRALDFNPDNPRVHYNLGLLYADQFENHPAAMQHLKRFLELDPHAKGANEARSYLLVREAYGDIPAR